MLLGTMGLRDAQHSRNMRDSQLRPDPEHEGSSERMTTDKTEVFHLDETQDKVRPFH